MAKENQSKIMNCNAEQGECCERDRATGDTTEKEVQKLGDHNE